MGYAAIRRTCRSPYRYKRPAVYLCPTIQLVKQVLDEAAKLGIEAFEYPTGEPHPNPQCLTGEAITVCTYDKLFNAKSTFDRQDVNITPCALVLDDAHAGVEEVRDAFTLKCHTDELQKPLLEILDGGCRTYSPGPFEDILSGYPDSMMKVPYWHWTSVTEEIRRALTPFAETKSLRFVWPYIRDNLRWCRCIISSWGIEIVPEVIPVRLSRSYSSSAHRLFMSATLADDSVLVRELDCAPDSARKPILAGSVTDLGERMVLVPTLLDRTLDREWVMAWCKNTAKRYRVVVLCASEGQARDWIEYGAEVVIGDGVRDAVERLKRGTLTFAVFAQRYDGVDLPDDSCRVLVLDGVPYGEGIIDKFDSGRPGIHGGVRNRLIYRIEQGMGRAVRSQADYAVVILSGPELASFTARAEVRERMSADTRAQLELAHKLAALALEEAGNPGVTFQDLAKQCLSRDSGWKTFYDEQVRKSVRPPATASSDLLISLADAERRAGTAAMDGDQSTSVTIIADTITQHLQGNELLKAWFIQQQANYQHDVDPAAAMELQKAAHGKDKSLLRPPSGIVVRPTESQRIEAPAIILKKYASFTNPNGMIAEFQTVQAALAFSSSAKRFEQALLDLAPFLGAEGVRPEEEFGVGPDNLLLWPDLSCVIEVKNQVSADAVPKRDAEQLLHSVEWFKKSYPTRKASPLLVIKNKKVGRGVHLPEDSRIVTPDKLERLLKAIQAFLVALVEKPASAWDVKQVAQLQIKHKLATKQVLGEYSHQA